MFPEATISRSFVPMSAKSGAARMALEANVPLIPGAVWGTQRILTKGRPRNLQRGVPITILIGEPVPYRSDEDPVEITKRLMDRITELLEKAQASYPDQPAGEDDRWWLPAHLGGTAPSVAEAEAERIAELQERRRQRRANPA
jgi:1-acyl-sn-glycerol-3-phosphate acyltransferase